MKTFNYLQYLDTTHTCGVLQNFPYRSLEVMPRFHHIPNHTEQNNSRKDQRAPIGVLRRRRHVLRPKGPKEHKGRVTAGKEVIRRAKGLA